MRNCCIPISLKVSLKEFLNAHAYPLAYELRPTESHFDWHADMDLPKLGLKGQFHTMGMKEA